jgi:hypothetical protein
MGFLPIPIGAIEQIPTINPLQQQMRLFSQALSAFLRLSVPNIPDFSLYH